MTRVFDNHVLLHISDRATCIYFEDLAWDMGKPEDFGHVFSLRVKLPKLVKNKLFARQMHDSDFLTTPRELSS